MLQKFLSLNFWVSSGHKRKFVCVNWESISEGAAMSFYAQKISTRYQVHLQLIHLSLNCWLPLFVWGSSHFHFPQFWLILLPLFL